MYKPLHGSSLQDCVSSLSPRSEQSFPLLAGAGFVHDLERVRVPPLHVTVHCPQLDQSDKPPSRLLFAKGKKK